MRMACGSKPRSAAIIRAFSPQAFSKFNWVRGSSINTSATAGAGSRSAKYKALKPSWLKVLALNSPSAKALRVLLASLRSIRWKNSTRSYRACAPAIASAQHSSRAQLRKFFMRPP